MFLRGNIVTDLVTAIFYIFFNNTEKCEAPWVNGMLTYTVSGCKATNVPKCYVIRKFPILLNLLLNMVLGRSNKIKKD